MGKKIKLVQIGGGSSYTPDFADILIRRKDDLPIDEWVLMDIDEERNNIVGNFTKKFLDTAGMDIKLSMTSNLKEALTGADFVITTMRVGGSEGRIYDATIPQKYSSLIGQETTAPGGLAMGLRNIPVLLDVANTMEQVSKPNSWLINLANPSGMLMESLNQHSKINFAGLCNGPTVFRKAAAESFNADPKDVFCKIQGLNHLVWTKIYLKGEDVTKEAIHKFHEWIGENIPPLRTEQAPIELQEFMGWIPMGPYLRYYYDLVEAVEDQKHAAEKWPEFYGFIAEKLGKLLEGFEAKDLPTRAHMVQAIEERTLELYAEGLMEGYELTRHSRGGRDYGEAGLSLASAIWNDKYEIHYPDVCHRGTMPGLDPSVVTTTTSLVNRSGIYPISMEPMPKHMMSFILAAKNYELLAVEAATTGNYHAALEALIANPLIISFEQARMALNELLVAHKDFLPLFEESIGKIEKGEDPLR